MRQLGLRGVVRGKETRTTVPAKGAPCPADKVNRQFHALRPNLLWLSDFTYVATWQGFVYVAFVIDAYARRIVGWRVSRTAHAGFVLDALEQALHDRRPIRGAGLASRPTRSRSSMTNRWLIDCHTPASRQATNQPYTVCRGGKQGGNIRHGMPPRRT